MTNMTPDNLRKLSWRMFIATFICGAIGILLVITIPNPSYRDASDLTVHILAATGFGLVGIAIIANLVSLVSGAIAWFKGTRHCGWILVSAIIFFTPLAIYVGVLLNL